MHDKTTSAVTEIRTARGRCENAGAERRRYVDTTEALASRILSLRILAEPGRDGLWKPKMKITIDRSGSARTRTVAESLRVLRKAVDSDGEAVLSLDQAMAV